MQEIEDIRGTLSADRKFLIDLKVKLLMTDREWRSADDPVGEMAAARKELAVLSSDDAHDLLTKTFNPAFLQTASSLHSDAQTFSSQPLSLLSCSMRNPNVKSKMQFFNMIKGQM